MIDKFVAGIKSDDEFAFFKDFDENFEGSEKETYIEFLKNDFGEKDLKLLLALKKIEQVTLSDGSKIPRKIMRIKRRRGN